MYPLLPFESKKLKEIRKRVQKPFDDEDLIAWLFYRRFSIYFSLLLNLLRVSPNVITLIAILYSIAAVIYPWFNDNMMIGILMGGVFHQFAYFLDLVDGEVARLSKKSSYLGLWLDRILGDLLHLATMSIILSFFVYIQHQLLAVLWLVLYQIRISGPRAFLEIFDITQSPTSEIRKKNVIFYIVSFLTCMHIVILSIALGMLFHSLFWIAEFVMFSLVTIANFTLLFFSLIKRESRKVRTDS